MDIGKHAVKIENRKTNISKWRPDFFYLEDIKMTKNAKSSTVEAFYYNFLKNFPANMIVVAGAINVPFVLDI